MWWQQPKDRERTGSRRRRRSGDGQMHRLSARQRLFTHRLADCFCCQVGPAGLDLLCYLLHLVVQVFCGLLLAHGSNLYSRPGGNKMACIAHASLMHRSGELQLSVADHRLNAAAAAAASKAGLRAPPGCTKHTHLAVADLGCQHIQMLKCTALREQGSVCIH